MVLRSFAITFHGVLRIRVYLNWFTAHLRLVFGLLRRLRTQRCNRRFLPYRFSASSPFTRSFGRFWLRVRTPTCVYTFAFAFSPTFSYGSSPRLPTAVVRAWHAAPPSLDRFTAACTRLPAARFPCALLVTCLLPHGLHAALNACVWFSLPPTFGLRFAGSKRREEDNRFAASAAVP